MMFISAREPHERAARISMLTATFAPVSLYVVVALVAGDLGGPLNYFLIPAATGLAGYFVVSAVYVPLASGLEALESRLSFSERLPCFVLGAAAAACCAGAAYEVQKHAEARALQGILGFISAGLFLGFAIHWWILIRFRRKSAA